MTMLGIGGHQSAASRTDEWLTPPELLARLGHFDLDPCAPIERPWPTADRHYTVEDEGLNREWSGRVWLNPPYGAHTFLWLRKLARHGNGIALTFARTETAGFFGSAWNGANAMLFLRGRLHFHRPDGSRSVINAGGPSVLLAYGPNNVIALRDARIPGAFVYGWNLVRDPFGGAPAPMTFFIIDKRNGQIVNAVEATDRRAAERALQGFSRPETLRIAQHPSAAALAAYRYWLAAYRYWNERP